ncbi:hypothetical protein [Archaeoglobus neptunius]|uniref:hypothetical protein n=1 Tax=Archaeoglobus neptunius TaxID=2798580 RepID=UPI001928E351|nr:hypothetical protein [Archaeoglobus neptunius]
MVCEHKSARDRVWYPAENRLIAPHPYCSKCGTLKNVSSDRGKRLGFFTGVLSSLRRDLEQKGYKISRAQIRLIVKELEFLDDVYAYSYSRQKEIFVEIVRKYIKVSRERILSYL